MKKFIPVNKMTKKQQKEYFAKQRNTWGGLNPVTRTVPNGKAYNRNKQKQIDYKNGRFSSIEKENLPFLLSRYLLFIDVCKIVVK